MTNPTNELYLLSNVDLDPDYNYTLDFDNEIAQHAYFENKVANVLLHTDDYSYIRADQSIKVYANIDTLNSVNYLMYKNADKWYYGFVTKKEYVSDKVTRLIFKIDPLQTFMFDYSLEESFIDREHQDRFKKDADPSAPVLPQYNLQPENLEIGSDYTSKGAWSFYDNFSVVAYLLVSSEPLGKILNISAGTHSGDNRPTRVAKVTTNTYTYIFLTNSISNLSINGTKQNVFIPYLPDELMQDPRVLSVRKITKLPDTMQLSGDENLPSVNLISTTNYENGDIYELAEYAWRDVANTHLIKIASISDAWAVLNYPRQNYLIPTSYENKKDIRCETKLQTHPYSFIRVFQNTEYKDFKYERIVRNIRETPNNFVFKLFRGLGQNGHDLVRLQNYNTNNYIDVPEAFMPSASNDITLRTDKWKEYELNNKASMNGGLITSGLQAGASLALGAVTGGIGLAVAGGAVISQLGAISNEMQKRQDIKNQPDQIRPASMDTPLMSSQTHDFVISFMEIDEQFKNNVFNYFYHYGYKCNDFKKPNIRSRYYFNYIKTIGANIKSNIDADYKAEIASIFDNGLTIWHYRDATTFKGVNNFEYENAELSLIGGTNGN